METSKPMKEEIEEMSKDIASTPIGTVKPDLTFTEMGDVYKGEFIMRIAKHLYNAGYRKQEWISVEDRLPQIDKNGKGRYGGERSVRVLCVCKQRGGKTFVKEGYYEPCANGSVFWRIPGSIDSVTHWMPLPEPPKMKGGAE